MEAGAFMESSGFPAIQPFTCLFLIFPAFIGFIENLVVFYLENSGHKITLYTKRWFALANHFFLCYNIFRYFSIFGGFLLTLNQYLL